MMTDKEILEFFDLASNNLFWMGLLLCFISGCTKFYQVHLEEKRAANPSVKKTPPWDYFFPLGLGIASFVGSIAAKLQGY